jgi:phosphatidylinositol alpha-1,6-mannosyltransferase
VPDVRWAVIGDGPLRAELEATVSLWGLADTVVFAGSVSDEERDRWLERSHAFAMLSRVPPGAISGEGFGIVYLEAGRAGLPVVAGNEGGAVDAVIDQRTGLLVDPEDHVAAAGALTDLLMDPARAAELGEAGREHAAAMSWDRMAEQVERVLRHVAAQSR